METKKSVPGNSGFMGVDGNSETAAIIHRTTQKGTVKDLEPAVLSNSQNTISILDLQTGATPPPNFTGDKSLRWRPLALCAAFDCLPRSAGEADSGISFDEDIDRPAEDAPDPGGIVQGYLDRILTTVMHQTKGNSWPQCYKEGAFWIRPRDNWFILNDSDDGHNASKAKLPPQRGNQDAIPAPDPSDGHFKGMKALISERREKGHDLPDPDAPAPNSSSK
ncbi:hypothetical protein B0H14DRAFT_2629743 [Mycena olivaceomarginata]|nr:hypothetical protein B0H14DRAFT_2629743 [Mycena olivaceomarginata]